MLFGVNEILRSSKVKGVVLCQQKSKAEVSTKRSLGEASFA